MSNEETIERVARTLLEVFKARSEEDRREQERREADQSLKEAEKKTSDLMFSLLGNVLEAAESHPAELLNMEGSVIVLSEIVSREAVAEMDTARMEGIGGLHKGLHDSPVLEGINDSLKRLGVSWGMTGFPGLDNLGAGVTILVSIDGNKVLGEGSVSPTDIDALFSMLGQLDTVCKRSSEIGIKFPISVSLRDSKEESFVFCSMDENGSWEEHGHDAQTYKSIFDAVEEFEQRKLEAEEDRSQR